MEITIEMMLKRIQELENEYKEMKMEIGDIFRKKLEELENAYKAKKKENEDIMQKRIQDLDNTIKEMRKEIGVLKNENEDSQKMAATNFDQILEKIQNIESSRAVNRESKFMVTLSHSHRLPRSVPQQLDLCMREVIRSKYFNKNTCEYKIPVNGMYIKVIHVVQSGDGELEIFLCEDGILSTSLAKTDNDSGRCERMLTMKLNEGQTLTLKAKCLSGNPNAVITFSGWLISPIDEDRAQDSMN